jgi:transposase
VLRAAAVKTDDTLVIVQDPEIQPGCDVRDMVIGEKPQRVLSPLRFHPVQKFAFSIEDVAPLRWSTFTVHSRTPMAKKSIIKRTSRQQQELLQQVLHPNAAGIDIGATELVVAVPADRDAMPVRSFGSLTPDLLAMRDWLLACRITSVAMESTGVYWWNAFGVLREAGIDVCLVNAAQVRHCPARKTDVLDAQWLMQLHTAGLLRGSFHPPEEVRRLRGLMRERSSLVADASTQVQRMQKALTEMNVQLHHILSDIDGVSGSRIIEAILQGQRDPRALWELRDHRCKCAKDKALRALSGHYDEEVVLRLGRARATFLHLQTQIEVISQRMEVLTAQVRSTVDNRLLLESQAGKTYELKTPKTLKKGELPWDVKSEGLRLYGTDLTAVPGVSTQMLATLISEVGGADSLLGSFPSAKHFSSWLGLCPDPRKSGGKVLSTKTRHVVSRLASALRLSAQALWQSKEALGDWSRRMKARLGKAEGITATAHLLARIIFALISKRTAYDPTKVFTLSPKAKARQFANLERRAKTLGYELVAAT